MNNEIKNIEKILNDQNNKTIFLFCHENPDGDALGGICAMKILIEKYFNENQDRKVYICLNEKDFKNIPNKYLFLPGLNDYVKNEKIFSEKIKGDVGIFLETANVKRAGFDSKNVKFNTTINIDHHKINDFYCDVNWVDSERAAVCEMVYLIFKSLNKEISSEAAVCLYTGILTDTGRFQYSNMKLEIFDIIKDLVLKGVDINFIYRNIYGSRTKNYILFMKEILNNLEFFNIDKILFSYSFVDEDFITRFDIKSEDMDGASDYIRDIDGVEISIFVKAKDSKNYKFSLRSKGNFAVDSISKIFGGGGHSFAAGFQIEADNIIEAKNIFMEKLKEVFGAFK
jgi:bifunctional oligoribonuclease and PAP phosphatase NrnA